MLPSALRSTGSSSSESSTHTPGGTTFLLPRRPAPALPACARCPLVISGPIQLLATAPSGVSVGQFLRATARSAGFTGHSPPGHARALGRSRSQAPVVLPGAPGTIRLCFKFYCNRYRLGKDRESEEPDPEEQRCLESSSA